MTSLAHSLLLVSVLACGSEDDEAAPLAEPDAPPMSPSPLQPASASTCTLPGSVGAPECNQCVSMSCCAELADCLAEPSCATLFLCLAGCLEPGAVTECPRRCFGGREQPEQFVAFQDCKASSCDYECYN